MLPSALAHKAAQDRLLEVGRAMAGRAWDRQDPKTLVRALALLQVRAARDSDVAARDALREQRMDAPAVAAVVPQAFVGASDGRTLQGLVEQAESRSMLILMTITQIADAGRIAASVAGVIRPKVTGYVRVVGTSCCSRCAILSGRFYRWSDGFLRHPGCGCTNVPSDAGSGLMESPADLFAQGRITDLSVADTKAIRDGADISQVVNVKRKKAGLTVAGGKVPDSPDSLDLLGPLRRAQDLRSGPSVPTQRLTPEAIYRVATSRDDAIRLLAEHAYIK